MMDGSYTRRIELAAKPTRPTQVSLCPPPCVSSLPFDTGRQVERPGEAQVQADTWRGGPAYGPQLSVASAMVVSTVEATADTRASAKGEITMSPSMHERSGSVS